MTRKNQGLLFGLATYIQWGFLSLFWKLLAGVSAYNTFSWRIVFTVVTMLTYALVAKQSTRFKKELVELWQDKKALLRMLLASFLIAANWLIYIYAVGHGQATQASLGYYIMPIVSILFALIFLRESLSRTCLLYTSEICVMGGAKIGLVELPLALMNPGDLLLLPDPGYPDYLSGVSLGRVAYETFPLTAENNFLPDLDAIPEETARRAKFIYINYPNNPTGAVATKAFYEKLVAWAKTCLLYTSLHLSWLIMMLEIQ